MVRLKSIYFVLTILAGCFLFVGLGRVQAETPEIYVRNQPLSLQPGSGGASRVLWSSLRQALSSNELERIEEFDEYLLVEGPEGDKVRFALTPDQGLAAWRDLLQVLGFRLRHNVHTGVLDFYTDGVEADRVSVWAQDSLLPDDGLVNQDTAHRRPGFQAAKKTFERVLERFQVGGTPEQQRRVQVLGRRVADHSPLSALTWTFVVVENPTPNAFTPGEGFVFVTTGLLDIGLTDDELAGVLGHEIAHGVRRHTRLYAERFQELLQIRREAGRLKYELDVENLKDEAFRHRHKVQTIRSRMKTLEPRAAFLIDYLQNNQAYGRTEEEEADVLGMQYAAAAGFDPDGEARALMKLQQRRLELFGQTMVEGARTHPPLERRIEILKTVRERWRRHRANP